MKIVVCFGSRRTGDAARRGSKADREPKWQMEGALQVSVLRNTGLDDLRDAMRRA